MMVAKFMVKFVEFSLIIIKRQVQSYSMFPCAPQQIIIIWHEVMLW